MPFLSSLATIGPHNTRFSDSLTSQIARTKHRDWLVKSPKPNIANRDFAGLTFDLETNQSRLVID
jgi:hypothetical protein